ncbi:hypothetical protein [Staphylococcus equorum]|nr:hypothetical protein [Staphylococcus equorum]
MLITNNDITQAVNKTVKAIPVIEFYESIHLYGSLSYRFKEI